MENQTFTYDTFPHSVYIKRDQEHRQVKKVAYYHLYLTDDPVIWTSILLEQFHCLQSSGLMANLESIDVTLISKEDSRISNAVDLIKSYPIKSNIDYSINDFRNDYNMLYKFKDDISDSNTETVSLYKLHRDAMTLPPDTRILYFHSKGVTSYIQNVPTSKLVTHRQIHYWRNLLNWSVMTNWKTCIKALNTYDICGIDFETTPEGYRVATGNFWWTKASYIQRLDNPASDAWNNKWNAIRNTHMKRVKDEIWVLSNPEVKVYDIVDNGETHLYSKMIPFNELEPYIRRLD